MSDDLYATRLQFEGRSGVAKRDWKKVKLAYLPQFLPIRIVAIDYVPSIVAMVMPYGQGWRDLRPDERVLADELLKELV